MTTNWDEIFVGRDAFVKRLLEVKQDIFIFGARRVGKTSLLKFVEKKSWENPWTDNAAAFYLSIQGYSTSEKIKRKIGICFRKRNVGVGDNLFEDFSFFDFLEELDLKLDGLEHRVVFLIDEAEQISEIEKKEPGFVERFRNCVESLDSIRFVLTASPHFKKVFAKSHCSAFLSAFANDVLPVMTRNEIQALIGQLMPGIGAEEAEEILEYSYYQPYLAKIFIGKLLQSRQLRPNLERVASDAYITNALDGIFPNYFEGLTREHQKIVSEIHLGQFQYDETYETRLRELTQYGYLKYEAKEYKISNWFFNHWLEEDSRRHREKKKPRPPLRPVVLKRVASM